jgi:hypothetical protein
LKTNCTVFITHQLGDIITTLRKKAALIMYAALLIFIVAGCGGGGDISVSSTSTGNTGETGGTSIAGGTSTADGTSITGSTADATGFNNGTITGSATLAWNAPVTNTDGTPLTDLAGHKIYYGTSSGNYTSVIDVGNVTTYTVTNLSPGAYYFAVTSYDTSGIESTYSNEASKIIQ